MEDIAILSIGIGQTGKPYVYDQIKTWKSLNWAKHLRDIFIKPSSAIDSTLCRQIMGGYQSQGYLRLQFDLQQFLFA